MAKLYFYYGAMNAGKSTILLQSAYNYKERGMETLLLKPVIDDRDGGEDQIVSRIGLEGSAESFCTEKDLEKRVQEIHTGRPLNCIFVDEAQFLMPAQVWQLARIADQTNIPVMCYGLRTDFQGNLFEGSAVLLALADNIRELKTLCWCGRKATMNLRTTEDGIGIKEGDQVQIGGNERYISLCRRHWSSNQTRTT